MDNLYFLIRVSSNQLIELYCIKYSLNNLNYNYIYPICFTASTSKNILYLLNFHKLVNYISIYHALYLGRELYKAEIALFTKQKYIQE